MQYVSAELVVELEAVLLGDIPPDGRPVADAVPDTGFGDDADGERRRVAYEPIGVRQQQHDGDSGPVCLRGSY